MNPHETETILPFEDEGVEGGNKPQSGGRRGNRENLNAVELKVACEHLPVWQKAGDEAPSCNKNAIAASRTQVCLSTYVCRIWGTMERTREKNVRRDVYMELNCSEIYTHKPFELQIFI